ncbi:MAG: hypothetical protein HY741_06200 [Chloroflexi bacterium]|nr:hypothetical protein [Chloroflexota bacterium]
MFFKKKSPPKAEAKPAAAPAPAAKGAAPAPKPVKKGFKLLPSFGKKKPAAPPAASSAGKPPAAAPAKPAGDAAKAAPPKTAPAKKKGGSPLKLLLPILVLLAVGGGGYYAYTRLLAPSAPASGTAQQPSAALANIPNGSADDAESLKAQPKPTRKKANQQPSANAADTNAPSSVQTASVAPCAGQPKFLARLGFGKNVYYDTSELHRLVVLAPMPNSDAVSKYQNQSWVQAGYVDAFAVDRAGNIYLAPSPRTGPGIAALKPQNVLYKIDTRTGNLSEYLNLPGAADVSPENPYGVLGLTYDCDTNSLYATTVTGSTAANQVGRIYRIDLQTNEIASQLDNVDAFGVATGVGTNGKRLYFGSVRDAKIRAVDLDAQGNFQGTAREVATVGDAQRAQRIAFPSANEMLVQAVAFNFNNTEIPQGALARFQYDPTADQWSQAQ